MPIKPIIWCHYTFMRMTIIKRVKIQVLVNMWWNWTLYILLVGLTRYRFRKQLCRYHTTQQLHFRYKRMKTYVSQWHGNNPNVPQLVKEAMNVIYPCDGILFAVKRSKLLITATTATTWVNLKHIMPNRS